mgnify:CR=1 FL=1
MAASLQSSKQGRNQGMCCGNFSQTNLSAQCCAAGHAPHTCRCCHSPPAKQHDALLTMACLKDQSTFSGSLALKPHDCQPRVLNLEQVSDWAEYYSLI